MASHIDDAWYVNPDGDVYGFWDVTVSCGRSSPDSGSLKEFDVICMNPDGFMIRCNITLSYGIKIKIGILNEYT